MNLTILRRFGVACLGIGFLAFFVGLMPGPYMSSGVKSRLPLIALIVFGLGWALLILHCILFIRQNGWAAAGLTPLGLGVFAAGLASAWWFLAGPRASSYPAGYGIGALVIALIVASQVLPRLPKK